MNPSTIYDSITDALLAKMEEADLNGSCVRWSGQGTSAMPMNMVSKKAYSGVNVLMLWIASSVAGHSSPYWVTYKQATALGGNVKKGEKGTHIVYFSPLIKSEINKTTGQSEDRTIPMLKQYVVFNADQCEGLPVCADTVKAVFDPIAEADRIFQASGAKIVDGGITACYNRRTDIISMPDRDRFEKSEFYYATLAHELTHWTGAIDRCDRQHGKRFGDDAYAFEELVAEIGASFLCADLGLLPATLTDHAIYLKSWIKVLKNDKKAIFTAASQASKAHQFIMSKVGAVESDQIQEAA